MKKKSHQEKCLSLGWKTILISVSSSYLLLLLVMVLVLAILHLCCWPMLAPNTLVGISVPAPQNLF